MTDNAAKIRDTHNTARYFVEQPQVGWALLAFVIAWGVFGYLRMPQRKDPDVPVRECLTVVPWPGQPAEKMEQLVTKKVEEKIAGNNKVTEIRSVSRNGVAYIYAELDERTSNTDKEFDDIKLQARQHRRSSGGCRPHSVRQGFWRHNGADADRCQPARRPGSRQSARARCRRRDYPIAGRPSWTLFHCGLLPAHGGSRSVRRPTEVLQRSMQAEGVARAAVCESGAGFAVLDFASTRSETQIAAYVDRFISQFAAAIRFRSGRLVSGGDLRSRPRPARGWPAWQAINTPTASWTISPMPFARACRAVPQVAKVTRAGRAGRARVPELLTRTPGRIQHSAEPAARYPGRPQYQPGRRHAQRGRAQCLCRAQPANSGARATSATWSSRNARAARPVYLARLGGHQPRLPEPAAFSELSSPCESADGQWHTPGP